MTRDDAKATGKTYLLDYLQGKGLNISKKFNCLNPNHTDKTPSMSFKDDYVKCFSCGAKYDIYALVGLDNGYNDFNEQFNKVCEMYNIDYRTKSGSGAGGGSSQTAKQTAIAKPVNKIEVTTVEEESKQVDHTKYINECHNQANKTDYFTLRGLNTDVIDRFKLGYDKAQERVIIPTSKYSYSSRATKEGIKTPYIKNGNITIFNNKILREAQALPIYIMESEIDALSIEELDIRAIGLGGTSGINALKTLLENTAIKHKHSYIISLDNDNAGETATQKVAEILDALKFEYIIYTVPDPYKDANEFLIQDATALKEWAMVGIDKACKHIDAKHEQKKEEYNNKNQASKFIGNFKDYVKKIKDINNNPCINTGFTELNNIFDGGFYPGLYIIGAISSLGKTTYCLQIADQVAKAGQDVLIFSLEMSKYELNAKSLSRQTYILNDEKDTNKSDSSTVRQITKPKTYDTKGDKFPNSPRVNLIEQSFNAYKEIAENIYIMEGQGVISAKEITDQVKEHINLTGKKPLVIIDYLQLLAPKDPASRQTDKQNTDANVLLLKQLSRDYKVTILAVSSFNRENYNSKVSMSSFKESGAIEYSSDVLIGMQLEGVGETYKDGKNRVKLKDFDVDKAKAETPRKVEVVILKNRNGVTGKKISYDFYSKYNYFKENDTDNYFNKNLEEQEKKESKAVSTSKANDLKMAEKFKKWKP